MVSVLLLAGLALALQFQNQFVAEGDEKISVPRAMKIWGSPTAHREAETAKAHRG